MGNIFGIVNRNGEHIDVSNTERGAKNYATRHGYKQVSIRFNSGYNVAIIALKHGNKWRKPTGNQ